MHICISIEKISKTYSVKDHAACLCLSVTANVTTMNSHTVYSKMWVMSVLGNGGGIDHP